MDTDKSSIAWDKDIPLFLSFFHIFGFYEEKITYWIKLDGSLRSFILPKRKIASVADYV